MKQYKIKIDYEYEVEAESEEEAIIDFFENVIYDTQSDTGTFLEEHIEVEELGEVE